MDEFSEIMNHLSENARFALQKADFFSKRYNQGYMGTEHLLMGVLAQDTSTGAKILRDEGVDLEEVERAQGKVAVDVPAAPMAMMSLSEATVLTLRMSLNFARENGLEIVGIVHILDGIGHLPDGQIAPVRNERVLAIGEGHRALLHQDVDMIVGDEVGGHPSIGRADKIASVK